jgi:hypothetical protein
MEPNDVAFTRYLYEYNQVKYSLLFALLGKSREEALFWTYELYHSGFQEPAWYWVRDIYVRYYEDAHPWFKAKIDRWFLEWRESGDACLLGTLVGTLAVMDYREDNQPRHIIIRYDEDRHQTQEVVGKPRHYLKQVSQYPVRQEVKELVKDVLGVSLEEIREAYLGQNWLYYCAETPIWESRIQEGGGKMGDGRVDFDDDDLLEAFYERWGFEPDEQCAEMHRWHGIYL